MHVWPNFLIKKEKNEKNNKKKLQARNKTRTNGKIVACTLGSTGTTLNFKG